MYFKCSRGRLCRLVYTCGWFYRILAIFFGEESDHLQNEHEVLLLISICDLSYLYLLSFCFNRTLPFAWTWSSAKSFGCIPRSWIISQTVDIERLKNGSLSGYFRRSWFAMKHILYVSKQGCCLFDLINQINHGFFYIIDAD